MSQDFDEIIERKLEEEELSIAVLFSLPTEVQHAMFNDWGLSENAIRFIENKYQKKNEIDEKSDEFHPPIQETSGTDFLSDISPKLDTKDSINNPKISLSVDDRKTVNEFIKEFEIKINENAIELFVKLTPELIQHIVDVCSIHIRDRCLKINKGQNESLFKTIKNEIIYKMSKYLIDKSYTSLSLENLGVLLEEIFYRTNKVVNLCGKILDKMEGCINKYYLHINAMELITARTFNPNSYYQIDFIFLCKSSNNLVDDDTDKQLLEKKIEVIEEIYTPLLDYTNNADKKILTFIVVIDVNNENDKIYIDTTRSLYEDKFFGITSVFQLKNTSKYKLGLPLASTKKIAFSFHIFNNQWRLYFLRSGSCLRIFDNDFKDYLPAFFTSENLSPNDIQICNFNLSQRDSGFKNLNVEYSDN